jgi:hypothetical protein
MPKTRFDDAAMREGNSARRIVCVIEDQYSIVGGSKSGLGEDRNLALGSPGEGVQELAACVEMPKSQLFLRD